MRGSILWSCGIAVAFIVGAVRLASAQQEVYHPGETYDSLQAGRDAYWDAEAERRAKIGRQLMLEEQIQVENTWSDPQDKYRPVRFESYGPVRPSVYLGPTLADVYAYPQAGIVYYNARPAAPQTAVPGGDGSRAAPVPVFQSWPRVPGDIWGTPYYGFVRQPIGHVKIWTGRLSYIYKPVYASPAMDTPAPAAYSPAPSRRAERKELRSFSAPARPRSPQTPPPPPKPSLAQPDPAPARPGTDNGINHPHPTGPGEGQEI
jgi:hypothetical protein